jgi:hypothetical protein
MSDINHDTSLFVHFPSLALVSGSLFSCAVIHHTLQKSLQPHLKFMDIKARVPSFGLTAPIVDTGVSLAPSRFMGPSLGRLFVFLLTFLPLLACGLVILLLDGSDGTRGVNINYTIFTAIFGIDVGEDGRSKFKSSIIGAFVLSFTGFVLVLAFLFWRVRPLRACLKRVFANAPAKGSKQTEQNGLVVLFFWFCIGAMDVLAFWFFGIVSGTREWTALTMLSVNLALSSFFFYRSAFYVSLDIPWLLSSACELFSTAPWAMLITNAHFFYQKVEHNLVEDGNTFAHNNDYYRIKCATIVFASFMIARNTALALRWLPTGLLNVNLQLDAKGDKQWYNLALRNTGRISAGVWFCITAVLMMVLSIPEAIDKYPQSVPFVYRVGSPTLQYVKCTHWPATWLLFAVSLVQFLYYSAVSVWEPFRVLILDWQVPRSTTEYTWMAGSGLVNAVIYIVLASAAGSSDVQEFLPGALNILAASAVLSSSTSNKNTEENWWGRLVSNSLVVLALMVPYASVFTKSYLTQNTYLDTHESGDSTRVLVALTSVAIFVSMMMKVFASGSQKVNSMTAEINNILGNNLIQGVTILGIVFAKLLSPVYITDQVCTALDAL